MTESSFAPSRDDLTRLMRTCLENARRALPVDVPVGALIAKDGAIISQAFNCREAQNNPAGHAEVLALQQAAATLGSWRLNSTLLVVTLEPCPMCASAIIQSRVGHVVFGAWDPVMGACGSRYNLFADAPRIQVTGGILEKECGQLLRDFFRSR